MTPDSKPDILWKPRSFTADDTAKIGALYEAVLQRPFAPGAWEWQFARAVAGNGFIWFADHDGTLAGQYATIPLRMRVGGRETGGSQSLDTLTHPDYRRQGIFTTLAKEVYAATSQEADLVYGFPNDNSFGGFVKHLDFFVLEDLVTLVRPLAMSPILSKRIAIPLLTNVAGKTAQAVFDTIYTGNRTPAGVSIRQVNMFPETVDSLYDQFGGRFDNMLIRDHEYLRWRYDDNPRHDYDILIAEREGSLRGYCVCGHTERNGLNVGLIVDLFADPDDDALIAALLQHASDHLRRSGAHVASCIFASQSPFSRAARKLGFVFKARRFPFIVRVNSSGLDRGDVKNPASWHITFGDSDFV